MTADQLAPQGPIPITVVTGFLGAGKTTLVNRLVQARAGRERIGVVVNEAGEVGLDGELLGDSSEDVIEIADGCVCCTSQGELLDSITRLHRAAGRLDRIILETSGLADPGPVVDALASITHVLRLDTMVAVVDAVHALDALDRDRSPEAHQQIQLASHVVVSKLDLADDSAVQRLRARVRALNPDAELIAEPRERIDGSSFLDRFSLAAVEQPGARGDDGHGHHHGDGDGYHDHDHLEVEIFSLALDGEIDEGRFESWLGAMLMLQPEDVFRVKAILALAGEDRRRIVHGVRSYVDSAPGRPWEPGEPRASRIVVIGRNLDSGRWRGELQAAVVA